MNTRMLADTVLITGAVCFADPPPGFELVEVMSGPIQAVSSPQINNCGEVVFSWGFLDSDQAEVFLYDNGTLRQNTDNDVPDSAPDINDDGIMVWILGYDGFDAGEIVLFEEGETQIIGDGHFPHINNLGHVAWDRWYGTGCDGNDGDVFFYDGVTVEQISEGFSDRQVVLNDLDDLVWGRVDYCPAEDVWSVMLRPHDTGETVELPTTQTWPGTPDINDVGQVAWGGEDGIELWEDGVTTLITDWGHGAELNNHGDMLFIRWHDDTDLWQTWFRDRTGVYYQLTDDPFRNTSGDINDAAEMTWCSSDLELGLRGVRLLRRIRTGDVDFDFDVDGEDFAEFPACMTGPFDTDRLCECRFLDLDHDRDVDLSDFALFQNAFGSVFTYDDHNCCEPHYDPGCTDPEIAACVCEVFPECCEATWDYVCALAVEMLACGDCP